MKSYKFLHGVAAVIHTTTAAVVGVERLLERAAPVESNGPGVVAARAGPRLGRGSAHGFGEHRRAGSRAGGPTRGQSKRQAQGEVTMCG